MKDRILNLKKGDKCIVAIEPMSNASRRVDMSLDNIDEWTYEGDVISVGRKYITVKFGWETGKFEIDNNYLKKVSYGSNDHLLYKDIQEVKDEREAKNIEMSLRDIFDRYSGTNLTLDQLRRIKNIIEESK